MNVIPEDDDGERRSFFAEHQVHIWQAVAIVLSMSGVVLAAYISIRTDVNKVLEDDLRHDQAIAAILQNEREFATEMRKAWADVNTLLSGVKTDVAVSAALNKATTPSKRR